MRYTARGAVSLSGNHVFALARYLPTGALDPTFGDQGKVISNFQSGSYDIAVALALQPNGKIVVAGVCVFTSRFTSRQSFALARYRSNSSLDPTFGDQGKVITTFGRGSQSVASDLALQSNGKIVVAGYASVSGDYDFACAFALARLRSNGTLDPTFGDQGKVITSFGSDTQGAASALAIQPCDGRIVAAGNSSGPDLGAIALARYHVFTCDGAGVTRIATTGGDVIVGTAGNDILIGLGGNDILCGDSGNDVLIGGTGKDRLLGGPGDDVLIGGPSTDICDGGPHGQGDTALDCEQVTGVP